MRGIHATLQNQTTSDPIPGDQEWLCSPRQKQSLVSGGNRPHKQVGSRKGGHQILPGLLQPPLSSTKTEPEMETYLGPQPSQSLFETRHLQNGNSGNNKVVSPKGGVGNVAGFQRRLLSYPYQSEITEVPQVFSGKKSLSIHGPSFRARHSSTGIHQGSQGGETDGSSTGYPDPPVPRRLVSQSPGPGNLPVTYPDPLGPVPRTRVGGKHGEIGTYTSTGFQFRRLPVRPAVRSSVAHSGQMDRSSAETTVHQRQGLLFIPSVHVPHRATYCHGKASVGRPASHETGAVASKKTLTCAGEPGEDYSGSPFSSPTPGLVVGRDQCAKRATLAPSSARPTDFYRRLKRRLGRTLRGIHSKRRLVRTRKSPPHQLLGTQGSSSGSQEFREAVQGTDCSHSNRQHDCSVLHQQRGRYEIRVSLCPTLAAPSLVSSQEDNSAGQTHSGSLECHSRQAVRHNQVIQTEWCLSQQVFNRLCSNWGQPQIDLFATRFNHKLPKFVSPVPDSTAWAVDALSLPWINLDVYAFPPVSLLSQVTSKLVNQGFHRMILIAPGWPNMPWFWDLISLSSQIPFSLPLERNLLTQPFNGLLHRNLNHLNLHVWLLEPRPSGDKGFLRRWQQELKLLREVQPERSISQSGPFLLSGATPTRWTSGRPL